MQVGIVSPGELFGGVERQVLDLCEGLAAEADCTPFPLVFFRGELADRLAANGIPVAVCDGCAGFNLRAVTHLRRWARRANLDLLHVHGYKSTVTAAMARLGLPVVKTEHGLPEPKEGTRGRRRFRDRLALALDRWATRRLDAVVCSVTDELAARLGDVHGDLRRFTIHNGIVPLERERFPVPPELAGTGFHVGIVGRLTPVKGVDVAIRALASPTVPDRVVLMIVGEGPSRPALERLAGELGLSARVRFLGFRRDVYHFLAHLDALLMPSHHEGLPYTILEAMSLGRPIVAARVGGLAEILAPGETALLVPPGAPDAVAEALARLVANPALAARLGTAAARVQRQRFTRAAMIAAYRRVYAVAGDRADTAGDRGRGGSRR